ncbi:MAG: ParB/RepB/Spo0J family partition protein [Hydrogenophilaceae bacterium]|jgi:ParB family chromosome partitioning protein|nr:ParB/RepB/Spo0J family partition protein [Hydrogenophilaceae bacterium]
MAKMKGLGRGLDALLGGDSPAAGAGDKGELRMLAISQLRPGRYQPRTHMDETALDELAESIRAQGLMQPILVRADGKQFEIIAGERRWRAAQRAGLAEVPVLVKNVPEESVAAMALIENIQREDLNAIDEAHGLQRLIQEFGMTHDAVAQAVGKSRAAVSNLLRLLNLSKPVQDMLTAGLIEMGHARALLPLPAAQQRELAHEIEEKGLSVREAERRVARLKSGVASRPVKKTVPRDIRRLEEALSENLGMEAKVQMGRKGGRLTLHFAEADQLQGMLEKLGIEM